VEELWSWIERIGGSDSRRAEARVLELSAALGVRNEALYRTIAQNLVGAGQPELALQVMEPYRDSTEAATRLVVGQALLESGRPGQALEHFRAVVAAAPGDAEGHLGLGLAWLAGDRLAPARENLERAVELEPALPEAWNGLGVILARRGRLDEAVERWQRAVALDATLSDTWFNLALVQRQLGRSSEAVEAMRRYAELVDGADRERAEAFIRQVENR
jgi:Flp pilus assembly protein TadD